MPASAGEIRDTEIERAVYEIVRPLAKAAELPTEQLKIHILADNSFNAFVSGGTEDIYVNTGLITEIESPAELAAVLAHEIGHADLGHIVQMRAKLRAEAFRMMAITMLGAGMAAIGNAEAGIGVMSAGSAVATQGMLAFTREEERAADDYAARLLVKAGMDGGALLSVFQKMQTAREAKTNPNNINHPLTEERIKNIKVAIHNAQSTTHNAQFPANRLKMVQSKIIGYLGSDERVKALYPDGDKGNSAIYARAIKRMRGGDFKTARVGAGTLISREKDNPYFYELLGDIDFRAGLYDDSVKAYERALGLIKDAPQIELALALVLAERRGADDAARAAELCRRTLFVEKMPLAWWVLAKAEPKKADYYLAEFHYMMKDMKKAKRHAAAAVKALPLNSPEHLKAKDILDSD